MATSEQSPTEKQELEKQQPISSTNEKDTLLQNVNKELLIPKLSFFFFFMATGAFLPYLGVYYKQLWLNARESGILLGVRPFIKMLCSPLWGVVTDVCQKPKVILLLSIFGSILAHWSQSVVSPFDLPCYPENVTDSSQALPSVPLKMVFLPKLTGIKTGEIKPIRENQHIDSAQRGGLFDNRDTVSSDEETDGDILSRLPQVNKEILQNHHGPKNNKDPEQREENRGALAFPFLERDFAGTAEGAVPVFRRETRFVDNGARGIEYQELIDAEPRAIMTKNKRKKSPKPKYDFRIRDNSKIFITLLVIVVMGEMIAAPAPMLTDSGTLSLLTGKEHEYGKQRLFGSFGWGAGALLAGSIVTALHYCPYSDNINYVPVFYVFACAMFLNLIVTFFFKFKSSDEHEVSADKSYFEGLKLFCSVKNAAFVVVLFYLGLSHSLQLSFLFWFLQDIGGTPVLFTLIMLVNSLSEVLMFFVSTYVVKRIGNDGILYLGLGCYGLRFLCYSYLQHPWYVLPLECLQGITYGSVWTASVSYVGANPAYAATVQGIIHGVYWGLGMAVGGILGGFMVHEFGARMTFRVAAACSFVIVVFFFALNNVYARHQSSYTQLPSQPEEEGTATTKQAKEQ